LNISHIVQSSADLDEALAAVVRHFGADSGTVHLLEVDGHLHLGAATEGLPQQVLETIRTIPVGKGMAGLAVQHRRPIDACNIQTDASGSVRPGARATGLAGAVVVPIFRGNDVVGALGVGNREERTFSAAEIDALLEAGRVVATKLLSKGAQA
jgi:signal transduction protein with GAF and PtsI domain